MKKSAFPAALLLLGIALSGCPVYDESDDGCYSDYDCSQAYGYVCDLQSRTCVAAQDNANACSKPSNCDTNETCDRSGTCVPGDCHFASVGCVHGYECSSDGGVWHCVSAGSGAGGSDASGEGGEPSSAGMPGSSGTAADAGAAGMTNGGAAEPANSAGAGG